MRDSELQLLSELESLRSQWRHVATQGDEIEVSGHRVAVQ